MTVHTDAEVNPERDAFIRDLLDRAAQIRMPELFAGHTDALWHVPNRHGVSAIAVRTGAFSQTQLVDIMTYRLVQYVMADQLDVDMIHRDGLRHEPLSGVSPDDIHVIAGDAEHGEILCYITLEARGVDDLGCTLATRERPLFPVEEVFGWGVLNRLRILRDLPVRRVREFGRYAKNHRRDPLDEITIRGTVELSLAALQCLLGPLREEIEACIGDIEEGAVKRNLHYFHVPPVLVRGVVPYAAEGTYGFLNYQYRARFPFAFLCNDIPTARLNAVSAALDLPGKEGIIALLGLKEARSASRSTLEPTEGLSPLNDVGLTDQGGAMPVRRHLLDIGNWLRSTSFFRDLSVAEAAVLGTFMERESAAQGETVVRQGDMGDDLYLIAAGRAEVQVSGSSGQRTVVAELCAGDCFGEIALVTGGERTADVVATTAMTLMRLSHDAYARYLSHLVDVDNQITHTALARTRDTLRAVRGDGTKP